MKRQEKQQDFLIHLTRRTFDPSQEPVVEPSDELKYYIVQFDKSLTGNERNELRRRYNLSLKRYIPNFAFLERLDSSTLFAVSNDPLYRASSLFQPADKISPDIGRYGPESIQQRQLVLIRVLLFTEVSEEDFSKLVNAIAGLRGELGPWDLDQVEVLKRLNPKGKAEGRSDIRFDPNEIRQLDDRKLGGHRQLVFFFPLDLLSLIAKFDEVQWIEEVVEAVPDSVTTLLNLGTNKVAGTIQSGDPVSTPIWDRNINGDGQTIGIIDPKRVDYTHCMFRDADGIPIGAAHRKMMGFREYENEGDNNHGTRVASIAAGDKFQDSGNHPHRGIAWNAKVSYDDQKWIGYQNKTLLHLLQNQFADQVTTHSNSWHEETIEYNITAFNVDQFVWQYEENFVCGSTANSGANEKLGPPGTAKNALCVSASRAHPNHFKHGDGKVGPTKDGRCKPEICAPGAGIRAATASSGCLTPKIPSLATSFATPVIAGAAALVRQYYLWGFEHAGVQDMENPRRPSAALVKATLLNSTVPMEPILNYPNNKTGWGLVKLNNTLYFAGGPRKLFVEDLWNADGLETGQSRAHQVTVVDYAELLKITLVWTDPPPQLPATGKALINNLNLVVTSPVGTSPDGNSTYLGNVNFYQGFSQPVPPDTARDDLNNVEMVVIENPAPGVWTITVEVEGVNIEKQGYALVVTGSLG